ncbi:uncharacterized protein BYT42DRAFT_561315 [Radiomyces spectabilis]|uniref:uncharacterized protein n=1 Tax=Radiomyces spectabilis TaxID=64574 RepID=UPI00221E629A|nr:uncharacterized protein BYT42DRAFT_561315 [Radiomyces spectabilis]KAI8388808.1 hypothetical protein BYT42DRAFT_561315 [Radiomyces spectabilis]
MFKFFFLAFCLSTGADRPFLLEDRHILEQKYSAKVRQRAFAHLCCFCMAYHWYPEYQRILYHDDFFVNLAAAGLCIHNRSNILACIHHLSHADLVTVMLTDPRKLDDVKLKMVDPLVSLKICRISNRSE